MTVLVFSDKVKADAILNEIACTPFASVWLWHDPDGTINDVQYATDATGRCAVAHPFAEQDRAWLEIYLEGMTGVSVLNELPADWQYEGGI